MECSNRVILPHLKTMKVLKIPENGEKRYVISILKIIACIHEKYPGLEVQNLGETDLIVTYEMQKTPSKWVHVAKTILVVLITFFGAAFSAFHRNQISKCHFPLCHFYISVSFYIQRILINSHGISPPPSGSGSLLSAVPATYLSSHSKLLRSLLLPLPGLSDTTLFFVFHFPL